MSSAYTVTEKKLLMEHLEKGTFPLMTDGTRPLWLCLLMNIEHDFDAFFSSIGTRPGYEDNFGSESMFKKVRVNSGFPRPKVFLCKALEHLSKDFSIACREPWQSYIQRLRKFCEDNGYLEESDIRLLKSPDTDMGGGLNPSNVTMIPDHSLGVTFGSVPDQQKITQRAPCWAAVKQRTFVDLDGKLGKGTHYVLAHLLNHQINGPGNNELNLVPLWATANKAMEKAGENQIKAAIMKGFVVHYTITAGPAMKTDPTYKAWFDKTIASKDLTKTEREIIEWEQELPQYLELAATIQDSTGGTINLLGATVRINNFVPMTKPVL